MQILPSPKKKPAFLLHLPGANKKQSFHETFIVLAGREPPKRCPKLVVEWGERRLLSSDFPGFLWVSNFVVPFLFFLLGHKCCLDFSCFLGSGHFQASHCCLLWKIISNSSVIRKEADASGLADMMTYDDILMT